MSDEPRRGPAASRGELALVAAEIWRHGGRTGRITVQGRSMKPTLRQGDSLWFRSLGDAAPCYGDLVLFADRAGLVVHRVMGRKEGGWRTKGDGRATFDSRAVLPAAVVGRVFLVGRGRRAYSLDGPGARVYARGLAFASGLAGRGGSLAGLGDRALHRATGGLLRARPLGRIAALGWQAVVTVIDRALFRALHRRVMPPPDDPEDRRPAPPGTLE